MGKSAGPLTPPNGFPSRPSSMPGMVLTRLTASPPASATTWAIAGMSGSAGESFTTSGRPVALRQRRTRSARLAASAPNSNPPVVVFGHDALISNATTPSAPVSRSTTET